MLLPGGRYEGRPDLPAPGDNVFLRLIRNPQPAGRPPKERECAEMLAAVMRNAPVIAHALTGGWLAHAGLEVPNWDDVVVRIETEQPIQGKRDDLRITVRSRAGKPVALITVEVKVGSGLHMSSAIDELVDEERAGTSISQLENYDAWLAEHPAKTKLGVVLAMTSHAPAIAGLGLGQPWVSTTWAELARSVHHVVNHPKIPPTARLLGRHLVGFVHHALGAHMDPEINFDDMALLRAFSAIGRDTAAKTHGLVADLQVLLEEDNFGVGTIQHQQMLYRRHYRSTLWRRIGDPDNPKVPLIGTGVLLRPELAFWVWIETPPNSPFKDDARKIVRERLDALKRLDPRWRLDDGWVDLRWTQPLTELLRVDQATYMRGIVKSSLAALRQTGVYDALEQLGRPTS